MISQGQDSVSRQSKREAQRKQSRDEAEAIIKLAGFNVSKVWELVNGYWPDAPDYDDYRKPWWLFMTEIGPIQIGWRKRVMNIQWDGCAFRGIVTDDQVTKENYFVHASNAPKAIEYLGTLHQRATAELHGTEQKP